VVIDGLLSFCYSCDYDEEVEVEGELTLRRE
jgi:hypothetical protein